MKLYLSEVLALALVAFLFGAVVSGWATDKTLSQKYARCFK